MGLRAGGGGLVLGIQLRASHMLSMCCTTELYPQPLGFVFSCSKSSLLKANFYQGVILYNEMLKFWCITQ
jgi:hypothetical protein